jgi:hypothetical protein
VENLDELAILFGRTGTSGSFQYRPMVNRTYRQLSREPASAQARRA